MSRRLTLGLTAATAICGGAVIWLMSFRLRAEAGGLSPFDLRMLGYSAEFAQGYLTNLSDRGRVLYLTQVRLLDTVFPLLFGVWATVVSLYVSRGLYSWSRMALLLPVWGYVTMDLSENALIADVLRMGLSGFDADLVRRASEYTVTKFVLLIMAGVSVLLGMNMRRAAGRSRKGRGR